MSSGCEIVFEISLSGAWAILLSRLQFLGFFKGMRKQSTSSKSQGTRVSRRLKQVPSPEEVLPANVSEKHPKRRKTSEDTSSPERENTTGLAILPDELLLEILAYYPDNEPELNEDIGRDADAHFARRERLIALSQTCRNLRRFLRPYVWCRIEVFTGMRVSTGILTTKRQLAFELIRQLEIVTIRDPSLAEYVKYVYPNGNLEPLTLLTFGMSSIVNVMIGEYAVRNVVGELMRCLAIFPNVHTFKVNYTPLTILLREAITRGFSHCKVFPQIRSITVPKECPSLLKYFPGARHVHLIGSAQRLSAHIASLLACCPLMEHISLFIPSCVELFPSLLFRYRLTSVTHSS